jgi:uncharacterized protein (TIGR03435 family)
VGLPEFEVASLKPTDVSGQIVRLVRVLPGGRLEIRGTELESLIYLAFQPFRVSSGSESIYQTRYDLVAVPPKEMQAKITYIYSSSWIGDEHLRQMLQNLLIRRFQLRFHYEAKRGDVYLLEKGAKPPAFRSAEFDPTLPSVRRAPIYQRDGHWLLRGATMAELATYISGALKSPVFDQTGLTGTYDYTQRRSDADSEQRADLDESFIAFFPELSLKLVKTKGQIRTLVIDSAQMPSPN